MVSHEAGFVVDSRGLYVPERLAFRSTITQPYDNYVGHFGEEGLTNRGYNYGYSLYRDEQTLVTRFPRKGSGWDDLVSGHIADGNISNVGVSPVVFTEITGMLRQHQTKAKTATIELTGKKTPVRTARDAIARFNDSPLGVTDAISEMVYGLHVYNRGAPIATVPITMDFNLWEEHGLNPIQIDPKNDKKFRLDVDWSKHGPAIPFLPSIFDLEPTGNNEFPYWYRARRGKDDYVWVLLHRTHILPVILNKSQMPGIGTSTVWNLLDVIANNILVVDRRLELTMNAIGDGILGISGIQQGPKYIRDRIEGTTEENEQRGNVLVKGTTIITSPLNDIKMVRMSLRQDDGVGFQEWREYLEDKVVHAFGDSLSALAIRGGVGYGAQSGTAADQSSDSGVGALLHFMGTALGQIYNRVSVSVKTPNDRAQRLNITTLGTFATAMKDIALASGGQSADGESSAEPILSRDEIRAIIHRDILAIPDTGPSAGTATPNSNATPDDPIMNQDLLPLPNYTGMIMGYQRAFAPVIPIDDGNDYPVIAPAPQTEPDTQFDEDFPDYAGLLRSTPIEDGSEDDEENQNRWIWLPVSVYYLRPRERVQPGQTRVVDDEELLILRNTIPENRQLDVNELSRLVASGEISIQEYNRRMKRHAHTSNTHQYVMRRGGHNAMTPQDYAWLVGRIQNDFDDIDALSDRIKEGRYTEGQIAVYSGNVMQGSRTSAERGYSSAYGLELPAYPADGTSVCQKGCKCHWDINALTGEGNFDAYWVRTIAESCPTCVERGNTWNPLRIRNWEY